MGQSKQTISTGAKAVSQTEQQKLKAVGKHSVVRPGCFIQPVQDGCCRLGLKKTGVAAVKSTCSSWRGPGLGSQHGHYGSQPSIRQLQGLQCPLLIHGTQAHTWRIFYPLPPPCTAPGRVKPGCFSASLTSLLYQTGFSCALFQSGPA